MRAIFFHRQTDCRRPPAPGSSRLRVSMLISVMLPTYNSVRPLSASLRSLARQTDDRFEVIVADDGSTRETAELIASLEPELPYALFHMRQEDEGFRLARARNLALTRCRGEYVLFMDGDCIVLPDFIARHRRLAKAGHFVSGKRSWLRQDFSRRWLDNPTTDGRLTWFMRSLRNKCTRPLEFVPRRDGAWRYRKRRDWRGVQTCNLGVWRADALAINGFDNRYLGPGLEDSDFAVRLIRNGTLRKLGDRSSPVLHLWHERRQSPSDSPNGRLFQNVLESGRSWAEDGLSSIPRRTGPPSGNRAPADPSRPSP